MLQINVYEMFSHNIGATPETNKNISDLTYAEVEMHLDPEWAKQFHYINQLPTAIVDLRLQCFDEYKNKHVITNIQHTAKCQMKKHVFMHRKMSQC